MKQTVAALQGLMKSGWCAHRRNPSVTMMTKQDEGPTIERSLPPVTDKQVLSSEATIFTPVSPHLEPSSDIQNKARDIATKETSTLGPAVTKCLSSKQQQLNPAAKVFMPLKVTSDTDGSTTAGSGDLTEDDRLYVSGPELGAPPGLAPPPGLELCGFKAPPGLQRPLDTTFETPILQAGMLQGAQLDAQAAAFVPAVCKNASSINKKISDSSELDMNDSISDSNPSKFIGATLHLQQSLSKLRGALEEWEKITQDVPVSNAATQAVADTEPVELMSSSLSGVDIPASTVLGKPTISNEMFNCYQQPWNAQAMQPTAFVPYAAQLGMLDPAWQEQQFWQDGYNLWNTPKQSRRQVAPAEIKMTADGEPADTLRASMQELDKMQAECVFIVRRIYRLGLESPTVLAAHFAAYGVVNKVLICHSRSKSKSGCRPVKVRAAGLGFVCMSSPEAVSNILSLGGQQVVNGALITVQAYEARAREGTTQEEEDEANA